MIRLAWIGLGRLGMALVPRLARAGYQVAVWDSDAAARSKAAGLGLAVVRSAREAADGVDGLFLCLPAADAVLDTLFGPLAVVPTLRRGAVVVDHSTTHPDIARSIAEQLREPHGVAFVDAPVTVASRATPEPSVIAWLGGEPGPVATVAPWLQAYAERTVHMGGAGAGQFAKSCNQAVVGAAIAAWAEMLDYARASGFDAAQMAAALRGGAADSPAARQFSAQLEEGCLPERSQRNFLKDLDIVLDLAATAGVAMPICERARDTIRSTASR